MGKGGQQTFIHCNEMCENMSKCISMAPKLETKRKEYPKVLFLIKWYNLKGCTENTL